MSITSKLILGFGTCLFLVLIISYLGLRQSNGLMAEYRALSQDTVQGELYLSHAQDALWQLRFDVAQFLIVDQAQRAKIIEESPKWTAMVEENLSKFEATSLSRKQRKELAELKLMYADYAKARPKFLALEGTGRHKEALAWRAKTTMPFGAATVNDLNALINLTDQRGDNQIKKTLRRGTEGIEKLFISVAGVLLVGLVVTFYVARKTRTAEKMMLRMAYYDDLTGLPNRAFFSNQVESALRFADEESAQAAVMLVDLDNFKRINDTFGHRIGDQVLTTVSKRLDRCLRRSDLVSRVVSEKGKEVVARFGGDEFTILLSMIKHEDDPAIVARRIRDALIDPLILDGQEVFITLSIGISIFPRDGQTLEVLLKNADTAMYRAKSLGKNGYQFYCEWMNEKAMERITLESGLYKAVEQGDFQLHYQPKLRLRTGDISGVEALIRWPHPEMGMIYPDRFIPIAEENGLIVPITRWVLAQACRQAKSWQKEISPVAVAVNISTQLFKHGDLVGMVTDALKAADLEPKYLELEITESVMLHETTEAMKILDRFREMGLSVSIDDFGTGYSSFSYLKKVPVDAVKIDRSFIKELPGSTEDLAIVKAIIATAHSLGLRVIAEGVETAEQLPLLNLQECDEIQGYLLSKPITAEGITTLLTGKGNAVGHLTYASGKKQPEPLDRAGVALGASRT